MSSVGEKIAEETNFFKDNYQDNLDFKVSLYAAFQTRKEFEYLDFLIELYNINKKFNLCSFDMILRFNDGAKIQGIPTLENYFDDDFFKTNINNDECSKIYICGDSKMNKIMPEICLRNHIDREKIKIV